MVPFRASLMVIGLATRLLVSAQQDPQYTMYLWNTLAVNPGYAGSADVLTATAMSRQQWLGLEGAPSTQSLVLHAPLPQRSLGAGLSVVHDKAGPATTTSITGDIAYRLRTGPHSRLAFGVKGGVDLFQADLTRLQNVSPDDPMFQQNIRNSTRPNVGFGLYHWSRNAFFGLSLPRLLQQDFATAGPSLGTALYGRRHYFLIAGCILPLGYDLKLKPSIMVKAVEGAPLAADITAHLIFLDKLWVGASYRMGDSMGALVCYQISDRLRAGYAHDLTLSGLRDQHSGSHELMIGFDLKTNKDMVLSPRYF